MIRRFFAATGGRWSPFIYAVSIVVVVIGGIWYTGYNQRQSDHRWCELLNIITSGPAPPPGPAGERARVVGAELEKLRKSFGC